MALIARGPFINHTELPVPVCLKAVTTSHLSPQLTQASRCTHENQLSHEQSADQSEQSKTCLSKLLSKPTTQTPWAQVCSCHSLAVQMIFFRDDVPQHPAKKWIWLVLFYPGLTLQWWHRRGSENYWRCGWMWVPHSIYKLYWIML